MGGHCQQGDLISLPYTKWAVQNMKNLDGELWTQRQQGDITGIPKIIGEVTQTDSNVIL